MKPKSGYKAYMKICSESTSEEATNGNNQLQKARSKKMNL
jgi:hypothetical protein